MSPQEAAIKNSRAYQQLLALQTYLIGKLDRPNYPPRLQHFSQLLFSCNQPSIVPNRQNLLQQAEVFQHHSFIKRDRYYDAIRILLAENVEDISKAVPVFISDLTILKQRVNATTKDYQFAESVLTQLEGFAKAAKKISMSLSS